MSSVEAPPGVLAATLAVGVGGVSAHTDNIKKRPEFHRMITDLQEGRVQAQVVVTHTLDRFARNLMLAINTLKDMSKLGIIYSSVTESDFAYSNPDKR